MIILETEKTTQALASFLAGKAGAGDAILLSGPLGAGKSVLARAFVRAFCQDAGLDVPSPTYTLVQPYAAAACTVHHFDLWRLGGPDELDELGWDDARDGLVLVEWPERLEDMTPADALHITLDVRPDGTRVAHLRGWADRFDAQALRAAGFAPAPAAQGVVEQGRASPDGAQG
ncbi:tRNA (adenosine(37)-N6)-threonylcarbamoyltransferase complex ATPase subunit type 1 TsaE [Acetobacter suratthaniensis]|uniref:tRNA threonylcarbamoyladenosine biosynthesis protein TsaE n=1 Tax=Acetobacter suratthaniensis TaxID=1502841 RepID=A0ABS3LNC9_9PROT|nr:tRNA (adenosine(37)-N6)-threonylcarbamoyltransferase complex ATPase subunit type 1 TsaE [Acetobacter suratthaniensis]MBO1328860.1 tRNA (adenosine(37)-N6)-threonylcarbamoyltransferase complex ATPase subunit type 1 TsaE [Acetobacter suratthaniensis]MCX2567009.1 tRNA (adenosine(37)-N6)-threonylcarbamoyltransferase complex ATPase subunit type 1 TsaE [Acetobacter suratthaniensis]